MSAEPWLPVAAPSVTTSKPNVNAGLQATWTVGRYVLMDVLRNRWVIGYALFFGFATEALLRLGGTTPRALVSMINVVLLLIPLVTLVFGTIYWHGAREFTLLLLAQPVARRTLFHGLFAGLVVPLCLAFVGGVGVPLLLHGALGGDAMPFVFSILGAGAALTAIFAALAVLVAGIVEDRLKGLAIALGLWLGMCVAWDAISLWLAVAFRDSALDAVLLGLAYANPVSLARVLLVLRFDAAALMGNTDATFAAVLGSRGAVWAAAFGMTAWVVLPGTWALRAFQKRDF